MPEAGAAICLVTYGGMAKWASFVLTFCSPTLLTHSRAGKPTRPTPPLPTSVTTTEMHVGKMGKKLAEYPRAVSIFLAERLES